MEFRIIHSTSLTTTKSCLHPKRHPILYLVYDVGNRVSFWTQPLGKWIISYHLDRSQCNTLHKRGYCCNSGFLLQVDTCRLIDKRELMKQCESVADLGFNQYWFSELAWCFLSLLGQKEQSQKCKHCPSGTPGRLNQLSVPFGKSKKKSKYYLNPGVETSERGQVGSPAQVIYCHLNGVSKDGTTKGRVGNAAMKFIQPCSMNVVLQP